MVLANQLRAVETTDFDESIIGVGDGAFEVRTRYEIGIGREAKDTLI
jgi:hypothetical protein